MKWTELVPCRGATEVMYGRVWPVDPDTGEQVLEPVASELRRARRVCLSCPSRERCIERVMTDEHTRAAENRYGVAAGTTPAQRWSMEKRGTWRCETCDRVLDPMKVIVGTLYCEHCRKAARRVGLIPDGGDDWQPRHTTLARRVVAYIVEEHGVGENVANPTALSDAWGARRNDMVRVFEQLLVDGTLTTVGNGSRRTWVRSGGTVAAWRPPGA